MNLRLGSSSYITDNFGRPSHYYEYLPFGELLTEHNQSKYYKEPYPTQNMDSYDNAYKFNDFGEKSGLAFYEQTARSAALDSETGMYYYGARYYDPRMSIFVSVDPLAEQTMEPYLYTGNNSIMFTDPTGMSKDGIETKYKRSDGRTLLNTNDGSDDEIIVPEDRVRDFKDYNASYQSGSKWRYDGQEWNDNIKADILGFESTDDMDNYLEGFTTQWSRQNAIDYRQNPTTANFAAMAFSESGSQWTDPEKLIMAASIFVGGMSPKAKGLGNQFKSPKQAQNAFNRHVKNGKLIENYTDPISGSKSYTNVKSRYSYNLDTGLPGRGRNINAKSEAPHIDVNYSNKVKYSTKKVKLHYNGRKEYLKR